jgi:hypothetical protein
VKLPYGEVADGAAGYDDFKNGRVLGAVPCNWDEKQEVRCARVAESGNVNRRAALAVGAIHDWL